LSRIEVGPHHLLHRELASLVAAEADCGGSAVLNQSHKRDLHGGSMFTDDGAELYHAHRTTHAGDAGRRQRAAKEDISTSGEKRNQAGGQAQEEQGFQGSLPNKLEESVHPGAT